MATRKTKRAGRPKEKRAVQPTRAIRSVPPIVHRVFAGHLGQLSRHVEQNGLRGVRKLYKEARGEIVDRLRVLARGKMGDSVEARSLQAMLAQIDSVLEQTAKQLREQLKDVSSSAAELGARHAGEEFGVLAKHFTGTEPVVGVQKAAVVRGLVKGVDSSLLARHRIQSRTWSANAISSMERTLALSAMTGKPMDQVIDDVVGADGFEMERWRAERIVRTESSYAHNAGKQSAMEETAEEFDVDMHKRLLEHFDDRTGDDSFLLHGQTVPVGEPFVWRTKRRGSWVTIEYMFPPNRPNDRAVVIPWDPSWEAGPGEKPLTRSQLRSARPTRWRKTVGVEIPPGHRPGKPYGK